jgi:hypothetical protein
MERYLLVAVLIVGLGVWMHKNNPKRVDYAGRDWLEIIALVLTVVGLAAATVIVAFLYDWMLR